MIIDKDIPIYQILIPNNPISEYYSQKSVYSFNQLGYNNIIPVEATTPDNMPDYLSFSEKRVYSNGKGREWIPEEKAIWYSHYRCWESIDRPSIIIEHDCILNKELPDWISKRSIWSLGMTEKGKNLAALCYFIKPSAARKLIRNAMDRMTIGPVDGRIHDFQPWYPRDKLPKKYIDRFVFATHYIDPDVGTTKPKAKK